MSVEANSIGSFKIIFIITVHPFASIIESEYVPSFKLADTKLACNVPFK